MTAVDLSLRIPCAAPLRLSPEAAALARREAWDAYERIPHADLSVGRAQYRAAIATIDELEREFGQ